MKSCGEDGDGTVRLPLLLLRFPPADVRMTAGLTAAVNLSANGRLSLCVLSTTYVGSRHQTGIQLLTGRRTFFLLIVISRCTAVSVWSTNTILLIYVNFL